jgi:hypothetical protein
MASGCVKLAQEWRARARVLPTEKTSVWSHVAYLANMVSEQVTVSNKQYHSASWILLSALSESLADVQFPSSTFPLPAG